MQIIDGGKSTLITVKTRQTMNRYEKGMNGYLPIGYAPEHTTEPRM
jgi:hypothetical protein